VRDEWDLALEIATALGDASERETVAWRIYRGHRSARALENLLAVIGPQRRDEVVSQETESIHANPGMNLDDARFLLDCDRMGDLERYVIERARLLNGQFYYDLPALADGLMRSGYALAASLVYRSLLDSILAQARSKAYHHGRDYLRNLEVLAPSVTDWQSWETHEAYLERLRTEHKRKKTFWG